MHFWKMNGAGNDFVVLNNLEEHLPAEILPQVARTLCQRHLSHNRIALDQYGVGCRDRRIVYEFIKKREKL